MDIIDAETELSLSTICKKGFLTISQYIDKKYKFKFPPFKFVHHQPENLVVTNTNKEKIPSYVKKLYYKNTSKSATQFKYLIKSISIPTNLIEIHMEGPFSFASSHPFQFPTSLTSLSLDVGVEFMNNPVSFPPSLRKLEIHLDAAWCKEEHKNKKYKEIGSFLCTLPLLSLVIRADRIPISIGPLPTSLQSLSLIGNYKWQNVSSTLQLLTNLSTLQIETYDHQWSNPSKDRLPKIDFQKSGYLTFLPPTLIHLELPRNILSGTSPPLFPPPLISLKIKEQLEWVRTEMDIVEWVSNGIENNLNLSILDLDFSILRNFVRKLPPNLTVLKIIMGVVPITLDDLPKSLQHLTVMGDLKSSLSRLPSDLKSLELDLRSPCSETLDNLPLHLQRLSINSPGLLQPLLSLPPHLSSLSLSFISYPPDHQITLPISLLHLNVSIPLLKLWLLRVVRNMHSRKTPIFGSFPTNLQTLHLRIPRGYMPSAEILPRELRELTLNSFVSNPLGPGNIYAELSLLPPSLTRLTIHLKEIEFPNSSPPVSLPPSLTSFDFAIFQQKYSSTPLPPFPFLSFPPRLKSLTLILPKTTPTYLPHFPATLRHLSHNLNFEIPQAEKRSLSTCTHVNSNGYVLYNPQTQIYDKEYENKK